MLARRYDVNEECPLCFDAMRGRAVFMTACGHAWHLRCERRRQRACNDTCCLCRAPLRRRTEDDEDAQRSFRRLMYDESETEESETEESETEDSETEESHDGDVSDDDDELDDPRVVLRVRGIRMILEAAAMHDGGVL